MIYKIIKKSSINNTQSKIINNSNETNQIPLYEKREKVFSALSYDEYKQLSVFNKLEKYKELCSQQKIKYYPKNDKLWAIYDEVKLESELKEDFGFLSVALTRMSEILEKDKNNKRALEFYLCSIYALVFHYDTFGTELISRHINNRRINKVNILLKCTETKKKEIKEIMDISVMESIPKFYNKEKINYISNKLIQML